MSNQISIFLNNLQVAYNFRAIMLNHVRGTLVYINYDSMQKLGDLRMHKLGGKGGAGPSSLHTTLEGPTK